MLSLATARRDARAEESPIMRSIVSPPLTGSRVSIEKVVGRWRVDGGRLGIPRTLDGV